MNRLQEKIEWVIKQHKDTNHLYDEYLPYQYHLNMVVYVFEKFKHLVEEIKREDVKLACYAHDLIEDARISYSDLKKKLGYDVAELVYSVTNEKGKNRHERANDKYYQGILQLKYGPFVKLCDRIANVEYSKMTQSRMFDLYKKENSEFMQKLGYGRVIHYQEMFKYLEGLFE